MFPPLVAADELARRLQLTYPGGSLDTQLEACLRTSTQLLAGHVDRDLVDANLDLWGEAVTQLAVKLWDTANKGTAGMDLAGEWTVPAASATAGLVKAVAALWYPLSRTGGAVVA